MHFDFDRLHNVKKTHERKAIYIFPFFNMWDAQKDFLSVCIDVAIS